MTAESRAATWRYRTWLTSAVGIAISVALLWWAARGLDLGSVLDRIAGLPKVPVLLCVVLATISFPLRAVRWRSLLPGPAGEPLPLGPAWHGVAIGFMANGLLLLRAGEIIRGFVIARLAGVRLTAAWASIAVERVFDGMALVALMVGALAISPIPEGATFAGRPASQFVMLVAAVSLTAFAAGALILFRPGWFRRLIALLVPWKGVATKLNAVVDGVRDGVSVLGEPRRLGATVFWSLTIWGINAVSFLVLFRAFGIELGLAPALVMQTAIIFGIAVPSSPGFVGVFEAAVVVSLGLYGVDRDTAFAYAITYHAATFLPITLLGLYSVAATPIGWREVRAAPRS